MSRFVAFLKDCGIDNLKLGRVQAERKRLEKEAERLEDAWYPRAGEIADSNDPRIKAAQKLREIAVHLKSIETNLLAGESAIDGYDQSKYYHNGDIVRQGDVVWQATHSGPGPLGSSKWTAIIGNPPPLKRQKDLSLPIVDLAPADKSENAEDQEFFDAARKRMDEIIKDQNLSEDILKRAVSFHLLLSTECMTMETIDRSSMSETR